MWQEKVLSGRLFITVVCGVVFGYVACMGKIPPEATVSILSTVIVSYFQRTDRNGKSPELDKTKSPS